MYGKHIKTDTPEQIIETLRHLDEVIARSKAVLAE